MAHLESVFRVLKVEPESTFFFNLNKLNIMEREVIKLTNEQWCDIVFENYIKVNGEKIEFEEIQDNYDGSRRHTEDHHKILKRVSDGKFFKVDYETSVKDEMGWNECNEGETEADEVFPEQVTTTIYK
jgi:hypothetical protein